jgi:hypothetical protein
MLRLGMMTRRRCQVVGLAGRRFNPMLMVANLIDAMLTHLAQAARCRHRPQRASWRPSSALTIVASATTARNNTDLRNPVLDPRDTGIIANRAATVVNEIRILTWFIIIGRHCDIFAPRFTMTHERPLVHDPEKRVPVFPRDKRGTRLRGDHAQIKAIERDDDSKKSHHAPVCVWVSSAIHNALGKRLHSW